MDRPTFVAFVMLVICILLMNWLLALIGEPRAVWFYCLFNALKVCSNAG